MNVSQYSKERRRRPDRPDVARDGTHIIDDRVGPSRAIRPQPPQAATYFGLTAAFARSTTSFGEA
jgi:hypothetical protein